jgi:hypothetical protein
MQAAKTMSGHTDPPGAAVKEASRDRESNNTSVIWYDTKEFDAAEVVVNLGMKISEFGKLATGANKAKVFLYENNTDNRTRTHSEKACAPENPLSYYIKLPEGDGPSTSGTKKKPFLCRSYHRSTDATAKR